jgi:hypothetical protein
MSDRHVISRLAYSMPIGLAARQRVETFPSETV